MTYSPRISYGGSFATDANVAAAILADEQHLNSHSGSFQSSGDAA